MELAFSSRCSWDEFGLTLVGIGGIGGIGGIDIACIGGYNSVVDGECLVLERISSALNTLVGRSVSHNDVVVIEVELSLQVRGVKCLYESVGLLELEI